MLISALCEYYDILASQGKVLPEGYSEVGIHYLIAIDKNGKLCSIVDWQDSETREVKGKSKEVFIPHTVNLPKRTEKTAIDSNIIEHRPLYIFGLNYDSKKKTLSPEDDKNKAKKSHQAFVKGNLAFIEGIDVPVVNAYRNFILSWNPEQETKNEILLSVGKMLETGKFAFCLEGHPEVLLHEVPEIKEKWEAVYESDTDDSNESRLQCGITGKFEPTAKLHAKIKGVPGGSSMGNTMISFNNPSDCSYGKEQSYNSAVSVTAMQKYTEALNFLLADKKHRTLIDDTVYVYWAASENEQYDELMAALAFDDDTMNDSATETWLANVFDNIRKGKATSETAESINYISDDVWFYIVGLKPNSSRLAVKCIYRQSFGNILKNVVQHYSDMLIGGMDRTVSFRKIAKELVSPKSTNDEVSPALMGKLLEAVIMGNPYPESLLGTLIRRVKTDSDTEKNHFIQMNDIRMGLIKACINRKDRINGKKEEIKMSLDTENRNPAYLCGRLFCKLEEAQEKALGNLNRTIKDSYFASAASNPALTFPKLLSLYQHHLAKLDEKTAFWYDRDVTMIMSLLENEFPTTLSLKDQGTFMLGYYQQRNERFTKKATTESVEDK